MSQREESQGIGESNKLEGENNYHVWSLKMRALFCKEKLWDIVHTEVSPIVFPHMLNGIPVISTTLREIKDKANYAFTLSISDDMIDLVTENDDPAQTWQMLWSMFRIGDQSQILMLQNQIFNLRYRDGMSMEEYIRSFREVQNKLASLGVPFPTGTLTQGMLNGLPSAYDSLIQSIGQAIVLPTFEQLGARLLVESNRLKGQSDSNWR
jgi:hypothetical protein